MPQANHERNITTLPEIDCTVLGLGNPPTVASDRRYMVNIYPTCGVVAVGFGPELGNHGLVHVAAKNQLGDKLFDDDYVGGWLDDTKLILSLVDVEGLVGRATKAPTGTVASLLSPHIKRCENALAIAEIAVHDPILSHGNSPRKVLLQADSSDAQMFAAVLGRLHQAHDQSKLLPALLIKRSMVSIGSADEHGSIPAIYDINARVRYIFPDGLRTLLESIDNRDLFIANLTKLRDALFPDQQGRQHARFFAVNNDGEVIADQMRLNNWNQQVSLIALRATSMTVWQDAKLALKRQIQNLIDDICGASQPDFHRINLTNRNFVERVAQILKAEDANIGLGPGFSTQLTVLPTGRLINNPNGNPTFIPDQQATPTTRAIAEWVLSNTTLPNSGAGEARSPDYICVLKPLGPLTVDHQTSRSLLELGRVEPTAYVVVVGAFGGSQLKLVVRDNMYAPHTWRLRETEVVEQLLLRHAPDKLSTLCRVFRDNQYHLAGMIAAAIPNGRISFAAPYQDATISDMHGAAPFINNREYRPFIDGTRMDLEDMSRWTHSHFKASLSLMGELIAVGVLSQFSDLLLSDMVVDKRVEGPESPPSHITHLSAAGSFSDGLGARNLDGYWERCTRLYGNFVASWVARCLYHSCSHGLSEDERRKLTKELIDECVSKLREALGTFVSSSRATILREIERIEESYADHRDTPQILKMPRFLKLTRELLTMTETDINMRSVMFTTQAVEHLERISKIVPPPEGPDPEGELREASQNCVEALCGLLGNHLSEPKTYRKIERLISRCPDSINLLSIRERGWYFTILDIGARLSELRVPPTDVRDIVKCTLRANRAEDLYTALVRDYPQLNLIPPMVRRLHRAIWGLASELGSGKLEPTRRRQLVDAIKHIEKFGLDGEWGYTSDR